MHSQGHADKDTLPLNAHQDTVITDATNQCQSGNPPFEGANVGWVSNRSFVSPCCTGKKRNVNIIQTAWLKYEVCAVWEANLINWKAVLLIFVPVVLPFNQAERQIPTVFREKHNPRNTRSYCCRHCFITTSSTFYWTPRSCSVACLYACVTGKCSYFKIQNMQHWMTPSRQSTAIYH